LNTEGLGFFLLWMEMNPHPPRSYGPMRGKWQIVAEYLPVEDTGVSRDAIT
jgi:hypothetical protein